MRKLILIFAIFSAMLVLCACGDGETVTDAPATDAPVTTDVPATDAPITDAPAATDEPADTAETTENTGFDLPMIPV